MGIVNKFFLIYCKNIANYSRYTYLVYRQRSSQKVHYIVSIQQFLSINIMSRRHIYFNLRRKYIFLDIISKFYFQINYLNKNLFYIECTSLYLRYSFSNCYLHKVCNLYYHFIYLLVIFYNHHCKPNNNHNQHKFCKIYDIMNIYMLDLCNILDYTIRINHICLYVYNLDYKDRFHLLESIVNSNFDKLILSLIGVYNKSYSREDTLNNLFNLHLNKIPTRSLSRNIFMYNSIFHFYIPSKISHPRMIQVN